MRELFILIILGEQDRDRRYWLNQFGKENPSLDGETSVEGISKLLKKMLGEEDYAELYPDDSESVASHLTSLYEKRRLTINGGTKITSIGRYYLEKDQLIQFISLAIKPLQRTTVKK